MKNKFINLLFILVVLLALSYNSALGFEPWPNREHSIPNIMAIQMDGGILNTEPNNYGELKDSNNTISIYDVQLAMSRNVPLLSKISISSSEQAKHKPENIIEGDQSSYSRIFAELRSPFTARFLSHETSFFLQFQRTASIYTAVAAADILYGNGAIFSEDTELMLGNKSDFFAIAIDTPITSDDSPDSYSRFGIYYQRDDRARQAEIADNGVYLLDVLESQVGVFFDVTKPAFTDNLVVHLRLNGGYGYRTVKNNTYGYIDSNFKENQTLIHYRANIGLTYRFNLNAHMGFRLGTVYDYKGILIIAESSSNSNRFSNNNTSELYGTAGLDFVF